MPSASVSAAGAANGWVQERFLRQRRYIPQLSAGTEATNVIAVSISLTTFQEALNDYVTADEAITLECVVYEPTGVEALAGAFTLAATTGTEVTTTANARLLVTTTAAGVAVLDLEDIATGSGKTVILKVTPLNVPGFPAYLAVTFD